MLFAISIVLMDFLILLQFLDVIFQQRMKFRLNDTHFMQSETLLNILHVGKESLIIGESLVVAVFVEYSHKTCSRIGRDCRNIGLSAGFIPLLK